MSEPRGSLTGIQLEIMELLWANDRAMTPVEIWQGIERGKTYARTTVNTMVTRLCKRGWLIAEGEGRYLMYRASVPQSEATSKVADDVLQFFGGSPSRLVTSLLGSNKITPSEIEKLKSIINQYEEPAE